MPVINVDVQKLVKEIYNRNGKNGAQVVKQYFTFWIQWVYDNMVVPGRIERIFLIFDMKNVKVRDIQMKPLFEILMLQESLFKGAPIRNVVINQSWVIKGICDIAKMWFNEHVH